MKSEKFKEKQKYYEKELEELKEKQEQFLNQDSFKLKTNTAYLLNMKMFDGWTDFVEWTETKHEQHWEGKVDSEVEVTFKLKRKSLKPPIVNKEGEK